MESVLHIVVVKGGTNASIFELSAEPKLPEELKTKDWSKNAIIAKIDELIIWAKSVEERLTKKEE